MAIEIYFNEWLEDLNEKYNYYDLKYPSSIHYQVFSNDF